MKYHSWRTVYSMLLLVVAWSVCLPARAQTQTLGGFVDMHTHPMSHLGFGGKIVYGAPHSKALMLRGQKYRGFDLFNPECNTSNEMAGSPEDALGNDNALHGAPGADNDCGDLIRSAIVDEIEKTYVHEYHNVGVAGQINDHPHAGYPNFTHWPHHSSVTHQQMYVDWIRRAYFSGLRIMVALAVNNSLLAQAANADQFIDDKSSVELQLTEIETLVSNSDFMEVARTPADLRRIVSSGRLAVILGVETDDFGNLTRRARFDGENITSVQVRQEIQALYDRGVRYILPIHFSNTLLGGYAVNKDLFALSSKYYSNQFPELIESCNEGNHFRLDRTEFEPPKGDLLRSRNLGWIIDTQPAYPAPYPTCGHRNVQGLTPLGVDAMITMMNLGMMIDIDHMSRATIDATGGVLAIARARDYPLNSGHNGLIDPACMTPTSADLPDCNENNRTERQYQTIRSLGGLVGLGHGGRATNFVRNYRGTLELMGNKPVAIGTDANGLEPLPAPDPLAPVTYDGGFPRYEFGKPWDINVHGFAHYGMFPDYIRSWLAASDSTARMTARASSAFMSSAEAFARMWEKSVLRATAPASILYSKTPTNWCTHAGATLHTGDFNGDGHEDLLCRDASNLWINYTVAGGRVSGITNWHRATTWCAQGQLKFGDFNGDRRTDLLCREPSRVRIDYANAQGEFLIADANGQFSREDFVADVPWCHDVFLNVFGSSTYNLQLGDFDADGRTDLLCKGPNGIWIDYADIRGQFAGYDVQLATGWCTHAGATLHLADFNGDGRTDLLCRDTQRVWFDYADMEGKFSWDDWNQATTWCGHSGARFGLGDFNGDGRTDFYCRDAIGQVWLEYADQSGHFDFVGTGSNPPTDWYTHKPWCIQPGEVVHLANINGDARLDLVCKNATATDVRFADDSGRFYLEAQ